MKYISVFKRCVFFFLVLAPTGSLNRRSTPFRCIFRMMTYMNKCARVVVVVIAVAAAVTATALTTAWVEVLEDSSVF